MPRFNSPRRIVINALVILVLIVTGDLAAEAALFERLPHVPANQELRAGAASVITRFRFPDDLRSGDFAGVYLAGFASTPLGEPDALAVAWTEQSSGWFRSWGIQLVSGSEAFRDDPRTNQGGGPLEGRRYLVLSAVDSPTAGHTYETILTYDLESGMVSVWIQDITDGAVVYSGSLHVGIVENAWYATAGSIQASGEFAPLQDVKAFPYVIPRSLTWELVRVEGDEISRLSGLHLDRSYENVALHLRFPGQAEGTVRLQVEQGDSSTELLVADVRGNGALLPLDLRPVLPGKSRLILEYWYDADLLFSESRAISAGQVSVALHPELSMVAGSDGTDILGILQVSRDGFLPGFEIRLLYTIRVASRATPLNSGWHVDVGAVDVPVPAGDGNTEVPFRIRLRRADEYLDETEVYVSIVPHLTDTSDIALTQTGIWMQALGPRNIPFPEVGDYHVLRGDFHIHTTLSDGELTPQERTWESYMYGYDAIALTDHRWTTAGYDLSIDLANSLGLILIRGFETGIDQREHFVVLDIDTDYVLHDEHHWALEPGTDRVFYQDKVRDIIAHGGYIFYAHPGSIYVAPPTYDHPDREYGWTEEVAWMIEHGYLSGVEVKANYEAPRRDTAFRWALDYGLTLLETSDIHKPRDFENSSQAPVTLVLVTEATDRGVMEALRAGRTLIWRSSQLRGKEEWLGPFLSAVVDAQLIEDNGEFFIEIRNLSGLTLLGLATVGTDAAQRIMLSPHVTVRIPAGRDAETLHIRWTNVWSAPAQLYETVHTVRR